MLDRMSLLMRSATNGIACSSLTSSSPRHEVLPCLRGVSVSTLIDVQGKQFPNAIPANYGTLVVPHAPKKALASGDFNQVPVLQGSNLNEGRFFEPGVVPFAAPMATIVAAGGPAKHPHEREVLPCHCLHLSLIYDDRCRQSVRSDHASSAWLP